MSRKKRPDQKGKKIRIKSDSTYPRVEREKY
jgi:hypothetical protein